MATKTKDTKKLNGIIKGHGGEKTGIIGMLQDVQSDCNHLPQDALTYIAEKLDMPVSQVYSLATFYKAFSLKPRGRHLISVCAGTACHVKGAPRLIDAVERKLDIKAGETTADKSFTLEAVNCLGACALGPILVLDGKYYERMTMDRLDGLIKKAKKGS